MNMFDIADSKKGTIFLLICFSLLLAGESIAQVSIAPTSLFFDDQSRFSSLTVSNGGQQAQEISISTEFGYPTSRNGNIVFVSDSAMAKEKSIADWIKIFPQNFTIQPQQRQTVRFVSRTPNDLDSGGYWARVQVQASPVSPPVESVEEGQIGAQINLVINQVLSAHYRTRDAETGVEITSVDFTQIDSTNTGHIAVSMEQTGNAPLVGSISLEVTDESNGETVFQTNTTNSVYTTITRNFTMDIADLEPGEYTITGQVTSQRRDISQDNLLQITPVSFSKDFTIE